MPDVAGAWAFLENSDLVCAEQDVQAAIRRLAEQLTERLRDAYPLVLVVMGGAVVFAGQLLPRLRFPLEFVGRGDMSRGGLMLRRVEEGRELTYGAVPRGPAARLRGSRPPKLPPRA